MKKKILVTFKEYLLISLGIMMFVMGWTIFLVPNNLVGGGVTGIASIIQYATGGLIKIGYSYFVINAILILTALIILGKNFGFKTVYAMMLASAGLSFCQNMIPQSIIQSLAVDNGKLMSTIMAGIMVGCGIGMSMSQGGSTGGTDIIALIVNKYRNVSPGRMLLMMDVGIILSSLIVPSYTQAGDLVPYADKITTVVYGLILTTVCSTVLDLYLSGSKQSVQLFVLSSRYEQIADAINTQLHRGVTILDGEGWYTKKSVKMIMVLTRRTDLNLYLKTIKSIDPDAFLSVSSVTGVYGRGFDTIKGEPRQKERVKNA